MGLEEIPNESLREDVKRKFGEIEVVKDGTFPKEVLVFQVKDEGPDSHTRLIYVPPVSEEDKAGGILILRMEKAEGANGPVTIDLSAIKLSGDSSKILAESNRDLQARYKKYRELFIKEAMEKLLPFWQRIGSRVVGVKDEDGDFKLNYFEDKLDTGGSENLAMETVGWIKTERKVGKSKESALGLIMRVERKMSSNNKVPEYFYILAYASSDKRGKGEKLEVFAVIWSDRGIFF